jgi:hypothetical protein
MKRERKLCKCAPQTRQGHTDGGSFTAAELRCLRRTRLAQDFGRRQIDPRELIGVFDGPRFQDAVWDRLKARGLVTNGRGFEVRLTKKGEAALEEP